MPTTIEHKRLSDAAEGQADWKRWGPYLSERAWGTVREDYSATGDAWGFFPHDHARSRAYRWNEDGLAGVCDSAQTLCMGVALWNEHDPILKERLFGLTGNQGNHGEDVKEYYFYLDSTPTHSYMKMLYKYPQVAYPYDDLVAENGRRGFHEPEYELIDALPDAFAENRYFDVVIEYAKVNAEDIVCRISATNRGPDPAPIHILPHLWYRNTWAWEEDAPRPEIRGEKLTRSVAWATTEHPDLGKRLWFVRCPGGQAPALYFTENDTNYEKLFGTPNAVPYVKDGIHRAVIHRERDSVHPQRRGSKAAAHLSAQVAPGDTFTVQVRLSNRTHYDPFEDVDALFAQRIKEADAFYDAVQRAGLSHDERLVQRQAFAGLMWCKQFYHYDVDRWLRGDHGHPPPPPERWHGRNREWLHLNNA
jgi:hypothetical protein